MADETPADEPLSWDGVDKEMAERILAQGESFLTSQLQAALAADARATTMAGMFITLALAVIAGGVAWGDGPDGWRYWISGAVSGAVLLIAAWRAAWAARPIDFYYPGNQPSQWWPNRKCDLVGMLGGEAENYEARIEYNQKLLSANQSAIYDAFSYALCSPIAGAAAWLLVTWISYRA